MAERPSILVVDARFYEDISDELVRGALAVLEAAGVEVGRVSVPGALEIPPAIAMALIAAEEADGMPYDGFVALGCVIRGRRRTTTSYPTNPHAP